MKSKLTSSGVLYQPFMPIMFSRFTGKMNYRNHRKIVIIDGEIGYVGSINIGDEYLNNTGSKPFWRDSHLRIKWMLLNLYRFIFYQLGILFLMKSQQFINHISPNLKILKIK